MIESLEAELAKTPENRVPRDRQGWRQLEMGMSEEEVEELLGAPGSVDADRRGVTWHYDITGYVDFDSRSQADGLPLAGSFRPIFFLNRQLTPRKLRFA